MLSYLEKEGISEEVLNLIEAVPRENFTPEEVKHLAYRDIPIYIGEEQTMTKISTIAHILDNASIFKGMKVLEIGTGSGYFTALLSLYSSEVYTVEISSPLYYRARQNLINGGFRNIFFKLGDGTHGWREFAPYDRIFINAALKELNTGIINQLKEGGIVIYPLHKGEGQFLIKGVKRRGYTEVQLMPCKFVDIRGVAQVG